MTVSARTVAHAVIAAEIAAVVVVIAEIAVVVIAAEIAVVVVAQVGKVVVAQAGKVAHSTMLGNGWFFALVIVIALYIKFRYALLLAVTFALSGLLTQLFKRVIFPDHERPVAFLHDKYYLHLVSGVDINFQNSLVSGHTASAFACFGMLAFIARNKHRGPLLCFIAILVGFSRVYLMQHFFEDVFYGSMVGVLSSFFVYYFIQKNQTLRSKSWMDKSLLHVMKLKK